MKPIIIKGVIDRFEGDLAVIKTEDQQQIFWPKNKLGSELKESSAVSLTLNDAAGDQLNREATAKQMLNEILNTNADDQN